MALWPTVLTHAAAATGGVALGSWLLRRSSDQLLRLIAGLVAIFARDKRSRAARAIEVLRAITQKDEPRRGIARSRTTEKYSNSADHH
jgi:uncharacterized membrane protein YfcA